MAFSGIGIGNALASLGSGVDSGYYGALGNAYSRNLAQQKQTSETNLQSAQAQYFTGRNQTAQNVATTRADGMDKAAGLRTQAQTNMASLVAMGKLPAEVAGQDPVTARAMIQNMDRLNPNSRLEQSIYGSSPEGLPGPAGSGAAGGSPSGPSTAFPNPVDPSQINYGPPGGMGGASPGAPPPGGLGGFSAPPAGVTGMGLNGGMGTPAPLPASAPLPPASASPPAGVPMGGGLGQPAPAMTPAMSSAGSVPANPFSVPPVMQARINQSGAAANLANTRASTLQPLAQAAIAKNMADAGLAVSQGKLVDAKTGMEVPMDQAKIRMDAAQSSAATANAQTLGPYRQGLINNGQTVAGADVARASAYGQSVNQTGQYQQGMLGLGQQRLGIDQQNANTGQYKALNPGGGPGSPKYTLPMQARIQSNMARVSALQTALSNTALDPTTRQAYQNEIQSRQLENQQLGRQMNAAGPGANGGNPGANGGVNNPADPMVTVNGVTHPASVWRGEMQRRQGQ